MERRKFSRVFKRETEAGHGARRFYRTGDRDLDVHENELRIWLRELAADPQQAFPGQG